MSKSRVLAARKNHKASRQNSSRRLFVEGLEQRQVLAGNVLASVMGGNLMIRGDAADNDLHLHLHTDGMVELSAAEGTTINGSAETFVADDVRHLTRVHLGAGDDNLTVTTEPSTAASNSDSSDDTNNGEMSSRLGRLNALRSLGNRFLGEDATNRIGDFIDNSLAKQHLIINTGAGRDTVDAEVSSNVRVHMTGNTAGDDVSIQTLTDAELAANVGDSLGVSANSLASVEDGGLEAAANADLSAEVSAVGLDIATAADLDTVLTANLVNNPALISSANVGASSLLNLDNNLNGSIGGAAAANLLGDDALADLAAGNLNSNADLSIDEAATMALMAGNSFNMAANAADDFFANLDAQNQANLNGNLNAQAGLLGTLGNNDALGNGGLNSNINTAVSGAFQSRVGTVPLG